MIHRLAVHKVALTNGLEFMWRLEFMYRLEVIHRRNSSQVLQLMIIHPVCQVLQIPSSMAMVKELVVKEYLDTVEHLNTVEYLDMVGQLALVE